MSADADGAVTSDGVDTGDVQTKVKGRNRFCKQCKFTCTDSKEFLHHQMTAHGENEEKDKTENGVQRRNSVKSSNIPIKPRSSRSNSEHSTDANEHSTMMSEQAINDYMNGDSSFSDEMLNDEEQDESGRLIIAEEGETTPVTPTRCGNIQNRTYVCGVCEFTSTSAKTFLHHQKDDHKHDFIIYECDICEYATKYKQKLPRHRKLHFSGQDGQLLAMGRDLDELSITPNSSLTEKELREMENSVVEDEVEDDIEDEEEEEEEIITVEPEAPEETAAAVAVTVPSEKKKKTRQEVDPAKYFEVVDDSGIKFACSCCGNIYKWRKSLNKHWKEKHNSEVPDNSKRPPGLMYLVNSGNHTIYGRRRIYSNSILSNSGINGHSQSLSSHSPNQSRSDTPSSASMNRNSPLGGQDNRESSPVQTLVIPNYIGPFITNTSHPVYPTASSKQDRPSSDPAAMQSGEASRYRSADTNIQNEPLDFSVKKEENETLNPDFFKVKMEPIWDGDDEQVKKGSAGRPETKPAVLQCTKCGFVAKTLVDYSSHMTLHLNKRAFKCAECKEHFNGVDELNKHFLDSHADKIKEHKDAIQKIPHGLQQTYHLLKMPLNTITGLNAQELMSTESKQLKCNMCDFVAKWPAELQKHAVSHSEERPFICMVCGSTYKWKWDLVKHFEKSHHSLPNPYKRRETAASNKTSTTAGYDGAHDMPSLIPCSWPEEPAKKRRRLSDSDMPDLESRPLGMTSNKRLSPDDIPTLIRAEQRFTEFESDRPSSVPNRFNMVELNDERDENDHLSQIKITNVHSLDGADEMIFRHDLNSEVKRPITQETQKAVAAAVRQRLSNQSNKQCDENQYQNSDPSNTDILLPYKCPRCEYRARWPSEITQHMKNHSDEKPYHCPRCNYKSKWKWDVVKHMKRCGGGTIKDVIDTTKTKKIGPPNVTVLPEGNLQQQTPQPVAYLLNSNLTGSSTVLVPVIANTDKNTPTSISSMPPLQQHNQQLQQGKTLPPPPPLIQPFKQGQTKQPVFRSLINQGLYHCLECPFVGHSPAELKRHSVLHSEDKPFSCRVCGYSSRWKCDLKKHILSYNHYAGSSVDKNSNINIEDANLMDDDHEEIPERSFVKCGKCAYIAYSQEMLDSHLKTHAESNSPAKFKCKQCSFQGNDLSSFLQHRVTHSQSHNFLQQNGEMNKSEDLDEARLKHPRKQVKTFQCSKCNFVCTKRETMQIHEGEHHAELVYKCFYCDISVNDKDSLLDHIVHHSEFNPDEWETFFKDDKKESEDEAENDGMHRPGSQESSVVDLTSSEQAYSQSNSQSETQNFMASIGFPHLSLPPLVRQGQPGAFSTPQNMRNSHESGKYTTPNSMQYQRGQIAGQSAFRSIQPAPSSQAVSSRRYQCEWCETTFAHISTIYQHAQNIHPINLHEQEVRERLKQSHAALLSSSSPTTSQPSSASVTTYSVLQSSLQSPATYQPVQTVAKMPIPSYKQALQNMRAMSAERPIAPAPRNPPPPYSSSPGTAPESIAKARKTISPQKKSRSFQCTKCPFTAPNAVTYLRHIERHGSNCKHTCWFCDYSIDRLNLLYQHMKGTHPDQWKGSGTTTENPIAKETNKNNAEELGKQHGITATENSSFSGDSFEEMNNKTSENDDQKPVLIMKEQTTWRGVPIQICSIDGKKNYKCPKCHYVSSNATNTSNHVRQHGSNRKYQCKSCDYSVDNLKLIYHHMQSVHPRQQAFIEVNKNIEVAPVDLEMDEDAVKEDTGRKDDSGTLMNCPRCPFRNQSRDIFQRHLEMHSYNGKYRCEHCSYSVDKLPLLTQHAKVHDNQKGIAKTIPEKEHFTSLLNLKSVDRNAISNKVQTASCVASKMLTMQAKQVLARSKLNGRIRYKCSRCPYHTFCKNNLIKHRKQHIVKSRYRCQKCSYSAAREYLLLQHIRFHDDEMKRSNQPKIKSFQDVIMDPFEPMGKTFQSSDMVDKNSLEMKHDEQEDMEDQGEVTDVEGNSNDTDGVEETVAEEMDVESDLNDHDGSLIHEKQMRNYKCQECPFSSNSSFEFNKHRKLHGAMYRYKCDFCSYSLERLNLLTQHRKLHCEEEGFDPEPSPSVLLNKEAINLENSLNESLTEMQEKVSSSSSSGSVLAESDLEDGMRHLCKSCPYGSNSVKSFSVHTHMHGLNRKYICDHCDWSVDRLNLLYQHRKVHAKEEGFVPNFDEINFLNREYALEAPKKFKAQIQGFEKEPHKEDLSVEMHSAEQPLPDVRHRSVKKIYSCKLCPFTSNNKNSFAYHKVLHRMNARYTCSQCSYSVDRFNLLNQHMRLHEEEATSPAKTERMKCPKCPYHSPSVSLLNAHIAMHASGCQYTCSFCDFSSDQYSVLQQHAKIHEERRNSESPPMNNTKFKAFEGDGMEAVTPQLYFNSPDDPDDMTGSDISEESELKCDRCPFSTPSKKKLEDHDFQHGLHDRLLCPYCDLSCSRDWDLLDHVQVHFPGSPIDMNTLRQMMAQRKRENNNNISQDKPLRSVTKSKLVTQLKMDSAEESTPDSTVREMQKVLDARSCEAVSEVKAPQCTKVYVCQYCEREFENKEGMLQHEKLHLIGH
ncbi:uncharacterized protein LOC121388158 [Gigantopelta aegis]|uniref:uncharacterized protein LOC121388158 n=1 Tax=Gigantopelta aegis TaxID=1735272 RepID=UPI001B88D5EB|nr:uncharacterized protein LOC121388158 [Gigantopelta aegis]XP_041375330.1 uncharacterized protein LOC121388158 [Gigantopelta aegis]